MIKYIVTIEFTRSSPNYTPKHWKQMPMNAHGQDGGNASAPHLLRRKVKVAGILL